MILNTLARRSHRLPIFHRALFKSFSTSDQFLIINSIGLDRTGITSELSKCVNDAGGNVSESRAVRLGSHFSLMMLVSVPTEGCETLKSTLENLEGMTTTTFESTNPNEVDVTPKFGCELLDSLDSRLIFCSRRI